MQAQGYVPDLEFSLEDVIANRQGVLTPRQEMLVKYVHSARQRNVWRTAVGLLLIFGVLILIGLAVDLNGAGANLPAVEQRLGVWPVVAALVFALWFTAISYQYWVSADVRQRRIRMVSGMAEIVQRQARHRGKPYLRCELHLKGAHRTRKVFHLAGDRSQAFFQQGQRYRVYYIEYRPTQIVLSAEAM